MRELRVFHLIKGLNRGGAETLLAEGLRFADRERFELSYGYFHPELNELVPTLRTAGARVTCFGASNHATMLLRTRRVARHLREQQIDLVHCHLPTAGAVGRLAGRLAGVPVVYTEHNKVEWYRRATFWLNAWTYGLQQHVIAVSASVQDSIETYIRPAVPVTVVRNGIDAEHFRRSRESGLFLRQRYGIPADAPVVGNVAALIPQKRLQDWLAAARLVRERHPRTRFLLVGQGPHRAELLQRITEYGLQDAVHLPGSEPDVRPYLSAMDVYMMSSAYEGLPVALLEAMAMQCVPVCTAVGGIPEVLREGTNGFLTEPGKPEQLAARVIELFDAPERLATLREAARQTVEAGFGIERMTREVEMIHLRVLGRLPTASDVDRAGTAVACSGMPGVELHRKEVNRRP
jgi:L-malate glycosyltransferase